MAVSASLGMTLSVQEAVTSPDSLGNNATIKHDAFNVSKSASATTTPSAIITASQEIALVAGAKTIDLTSLLGTNSGPVSLDTKKPLWIMLKNKSTNTGGTMTFAKGATNGYAGFGASFSIAVPIGGAILLDMNALNSAVSSTNKTIDVTGSGTDVIQLIVVA